MLYPTHDEASQHKISCIDQMVTLGYSHDPLVTILYKTGTNKDNCTRALPVYIKNTVVID
jgi:hypothetical protein